MNDDDRATQALREWARAVSARLVDKAKSFDTPVSWLTHWEGQYKPEDTVTYSPNWTVKVDTITYRTSIAPKTLFWGLVQPLTDYELSLPKEKWTTEQRLLPEVERAADALLRKLSLELLPLTNAKIPAMVVTVPSEPYSPERRAVEVAFGTGPLVRAVALSDSELDPIQVLLLAGVTVAAQ